MSASFAAHPVSGHHRTSSVPFGLAVGARDAIPVEHVDEAVLVYDHRQQITLIRDAVGLVPWLRHSTGTTATDSRTDGHQGIETDEDHTED